MLHGYLKLLKHLKVTFQHLKISSLFYLERKYQWRRKTNFAWKHEK